MERKEAYKELNGYIGAKAREEYLKRRQKELEDNLASLRVSSLNEHVRGGSRDAVERLIDEIDKMKKELADQILQCERSRISIENKIDRVEFPMDVILRKRYLEGKALNIVRIEMSKEFKRTYSDESVKHYLYRGVGQYCII